MLPIAMSRALPPYDTNGRAMPLIGRTPTTPPMFTMAWATIQAVIPAASSRPNRSGARKRDDHAEERQSREEEQDEDGSDEARALPR